jgi:hypothetical protein
MRIVTTSAVALGAALLLGLAGASPSFAKAHDQGLAKGNDEKAGRFEGSTPEAAQTLGASQRSENAPDKGPNNNGAQPSSDNARSAADAR